ncbi:MAG: hypothetical protein AAFR41_11580, partial [Pseudomonadota bacterium]
MAFRFLHTADWQLGKSFGRFEGDLQGELKAARRDCISRIAALAEARSIDHVVVAGDVWDSEYPQPPVHRPSAGHEIKGLGQSRWLGIFAVPDIA